MQKEFTNWHTKKKKLNDRDDLGDVYFREKEIWWAALGANIGYEQDGKGEEFRRPVLIVKKFNQYVVLVVPLSTRIKENKYYVPIVLGDGISRMAIISQLRLIDTRRFIDKIGALDENSFTQLKNAIKAML